MRVAEEDVAHVVAIEQAGKHLGVVELDAVHQRVPDVEGRMMHEDIDGSASRLRQFGRSPSAARRIVETGGRWRTFQRIEQQQMCAVLHHGFLHVARLIGTAEDT